MAQWNPIASELAGGSAGGSAVIGGAADTIGYEKSRATKAKKEVVTRLARALKNAGANVNFSDSDSMAQIVAAIKKAIPDPRSATYQTDAEKHKSACVSVAAQLNKEFNPAGAAASNPIPTKGDARDICQGVAEFVHSLGTGIQAEFADVYAEIKQVVKNLVVVGEVMERVAADLAEPSADTPEVRRQRKAQVDRLTAEHAKQLKTLENLLSAQLADADLELERALADLDETDGLVKDIGLQVGTDEFSYALARVVASAGTLAALTEKVDKALKKAGISMEAFRKANTLEEVRKMLDNKFKSVSPDQMQDFMEARAQIEKYFDMHHDLAEKLGGDYRDGDHGAAGYDDEHVGGDSSAGEYTPDMDQYEMIDADGAEATVGGAVGVVASKDDKYDKRTQLLKAGRDQLMKQFAKDATAAIKEVNKAVEKVSDHLGDAIPINTLTVRMRNAIKALCDMDYLSEAQQAILTLEGASASQREDRAIAVQRIANAVQAIQNARTGLSGAADSALADLEMAVAVFEKVVDRYTSAAQALVKRDALGGDVTAQTCGGDEGDVTDLQREMRKVIGQFVYNFYTAKVKQNIANSAKMLDVFSEKYQDRMAQAVGAVQSQIRDLGGKVDPALKPAADALENFWRTMFALDDYMLLYTKNIAAHVKDVRQIDQMLDDVVLIREWAEKDMNTELSKVVRAGTIEAKRTAAKEALKQYGGLKNIVSAFARIGSKFAGEQLRSKSMMNETEIYLALQGFLVERAVISAAPATGSTTQSEAQGVLAQRFVDSDQWFRRSVRAMGGKIMVTLGAYDLLNAKTEMEDPYLLRSAIGGAAYREAPPVIPEVAELYFRIPRIMHFYTSIFGKFANGEKSDVVKITLLPDVEGVYGGIIRLFFKPKASDGAQVFKTYDQFSAAEVEDLVRECNRMYESNKSAHGATHAVAKAIEGLVREINSRYGLVTKKEWSDFSKFYKERRSAGFKSRSATDRSAESTRILPGEDMPSSRRPLASDRYAMGLSGSTASPQQADGLFGASGILSRQLGAFTQFRNQVYAKMKKMAPNFTADFGSRILQLVKELKATPDQSVRMAVVRRMISVGGVQTSGASAGVMLHETYMVAAEALLRMLDAIQPLLNKTATADSKPNKFVAKKLATLDQETFNEILQLGPCVKIISSGGSGGFTVDLSGVRETMRVLMEDLRAFYAKLSPALPKELAEEIRGSGDSPATGTVRFFEGAVYDAFIKRNTMDLISQGLSNAAPGNITVGDGKLKTLVEQLADATKDTNGRIYASLFNGVALGDYANQLTSLGTVVENAYTQSLEEARRGSLLIQSLADVNSNSRATMQAILPLFRSRFEGLQTACDMARSIMGAKTPEPITRVSNGAYAMASACREVLADIGEPTQFMEVSQGGFDMFKSRYGKHPLALLSTASVAVDALQPAGKSLSFGSGSAPAKAARGLAPLVFADGPPTWSSFGPAKSMLEDYNSGVDASAQIGADDYLSFINNYRTVLRCMVRSPDSKATKPDLGILSDKFVSGVNDFQQTLSMMMDPDQARQVGAISTRVGADRKLMQVDTVSIGSETLDQEAAANIVDLNIMPINVHALMRDVYFAEMLNYDYTFLQATGTMQAGVGLVQGPPTATTTDAAANARTGTAGVGGNIQASADVYVAIRAKLADILSGGQDDKRIVRGKELLKGL